MCRVKASWMKHSFCMLAIVWLKKYDINNRPWMLEILIGFWPYNHEISEYISAGCHSLCSNGTNCSRTCMPLLMIHYLKFKFYIGKLAYQLLLEQELAVRRGLRFALSFQEVILERDSTKITKKTPFVQVNFS